MKQFMEYMELLFFVVAQVVIGLDDVPFTLPETNIALKIGLPNRKVVFQPSIQGRAVSFREGKTCYSQKVCELEIMQDLLCLSSGYVQIICVNSGWWSTLHLKHMPLCKSDVSLSDHQKSHSHEKKRRPESRINGKLRSPIFFGGLLARSNFEIPSAPQFSRSSFSHRFRFSPAGGIRRR